MKHFKIYSAILFFLFLYNCESNETFDNKLYIQSQDGINEIGVKKGTIEKKTTIQVAMVKPNANDIAITYKADKSLVGKYNKAYYDQAVMLPKENYEMEGNIKIFKGTVKSEKKEIIFKKLNTLDFKKNKSYVLPVKIECRSVSILDSKRTFYYVLKPGSLIDVVADITENYLTIQWKKPEVCNNLSKLTMEALIRVHKFERTISTVMGIEGKFLIRIGDAGFPINQIQIATSSGNYPAKDPSKGLPKEKWVHIALTYDSSDGNMNIYVDGKMQSSISAKSVGVVNLGNGLFHIGKSWDDKRYLDGEISECRIWNVVRTSEEIAKNPYFVNPQSKGLVAYWKFDEGKGNLVKDHTGNGNDAKANSDLKWNKVNLPAPKK